MVKPRNWLTRRVCSGPSGRQQIPSEAADIVSRLCRRCRCGLRGHHNTRILSTLIAQNCLVDFLLDGGSLLARSSVHFAARVEVSGESGAGAEHDIHRLGVRVLQLGRR